MAKRQAIPGTGIGLALVERLTRAMGGRVEVISAEPGAEFRLEFPLARSAERAQDRLGTGTGSSR
ncbi:ATP-binding protein [Allochromatium tepidum]|uniref:ATP-binding protein n=1 Tax=Allochromatium tepidum TaxID=553982 RepID=UPI001BD1AA34|nr:ATP-binding protein [Allochromatium tepidum]